MRVDPSPDSQQPAKGAATAAAAARCDVRGDEVELVGPAQRSSEPMVPVAKFVGRQRQLQDRLEVALAGARRSPDLIRRAPRLAPTVHTIHATPSIHLRPPAPSRTHAATPLPRSGSLESRTLLREVEGLLHRAPASYSDEDEDAATEGGGGGAPSHSVPSRSAPGSAHGTPRGQPRAASAARARDGGYGSGALPPQSAASSATAPLDAEAVRAARLQKCDALDARLSPMRAGLDSWGDELGDARAVNDRLASAVADALCFSEAELAAELAASGDALSGGVGGQARQAISDELEREGLATASAVAVASGRAARRAKLSGVGMPVRSFRRAAAGEQVRGLRDELSSAASPGSPAAPGIPAAPGSRGGAVLFPRGEAALGPASPLGSERCGTPLGSLPSTHAPTVPEPSLFQRGAPERGGGGRPAGASAKPRASSAPRSSPLRPSPLARSHSPRVTRPDGAFVSRFPEYDAGPAEPPIALSREEAALEAALYDLDAEAGGSHSALPAGRGGHSGYLATQAALAAQAEAVQAGIAQADLSLADLTLADYSAPGHLLHGVAQPARGPRDGRPGPPRRSERHV